VRLDYSWHFCGELHGGFPDMGSGKQVPLVQILLSDCQTPMYEGSSQFGPLHSNF
jgi:hypothetical protein